MTANDWAVGLLYLTAWVAYFGTMYRRIDRLSAANRSLEAEVRFLSAKIESIKATSELDRVRLTLRGGDR
jgi:hypothetical protein